MTTETLTDEQAEAMLKQLTKHFREPVMPMSRYCSTLQTWARCIGERAQHLQQELLPNLHDWDKSDPKSWKSTPEAEVQQAEKDVVKARATLRELIPTGLHRLKGALSEGALAEIAKFTLEHQETPRESRLSDLLHHEEAAYQVERTFLAIGKSNLLARLLYSGEKLRTKMCPEHKGTWSGIEWGPDGACPHKCQLTGWVQESDDMGKPLPGVFAVTMVPTGQPGGEVTVIKSITGEVLGKAVLHEIPPVKKPDPV
jgi:hypothetical protein